MKTSIKRYALFSYETPLGGWGDFKASFEELKWAIREARGTFNHVVDLKTGEVKWTNNL